LYTRFISALNELHRSEKQEVCRREKVEAKRVGVVPGKVTLSDPFAVSHFARTWDDLSPSQMMELLRQRLEKHAFLALGVPAHMLGVDLAHASFSSPIPPQPDITRDWGTDYVSRARTSRAKGRPTA
jgi:hypothetical protein